jgi:hypothetical protein
VLPGADWGRRFALVRGPASGQTAVSQSACLRHPTDRNALLLSEDYGRVTIDLGDLSVEDLAQMPAVPRTFGDPWLEEQRTPVLRVCERARIFYSIRLIRRRRLPVFLTPTG